MSTYEKIQHLRISEISEIDLKVWMMDEIYGLANDCGQTIADDMVIHIYKRLNEKLLTAYRSWHAGTIHAAFQVGLTGGYGAFRKVTVQALFQFLKNAQTQMAAQKVAHAEAESERSKNSNIVADSIETEFLIWATTNRICLGHVDPEHNPLHTKRVSAKILMLADEFEQAKEMGLLSSFKNRLIEEREKVYGEN